MSTVSRERLFDLAIVLALAAAGVAVRLWHLQWLPVHFDNTDPFIRAFAWIADWRGALGGGASPGWSELIYPASAPWLNQFGPGLVWSYAPLVAGASSLEEAFARRYVVQALMAPLLYLAVRVLTRERGKAARTDVYSSRAGALVAALAVGFTGEPMGTAGIGDQTMLAPEFAALVLAGCALALRRPGPAGFLLAAAALPWAVMIHPMSIALTPGVLVVAAALWRRGRWRLVLGGGCLGLVVFLPELIQLLQLRAEQGGVLAEAVQSTNHASKTLAASAAGNLRGWWTLEPFPLGPLLLGAPGLALAGIVWRLGRRSGSWTSPGRGISAAEAATLSYAAVCANVVGLLVTGAVVGFLLPYHWRILLPGHALALGLLVHGLAVRWLPSVRLASPIARLAPLGAAVGAALLLAGVTAARLDRFDAGSGDIALHQGLAETIAADAGDAPRWFDAIVVGYPNHRYSWSFSPAVFLEQRMRGAPRERFRFPGYLYLTVSGTARDIEAICQDMGWPSRPDPGRTRGSADAAVAGEVRFVDRLVVNDVHEIVVLRLDSKQQARAWTGWLHGRFSPGATRLILDSNHVLPLTTDGHDTADSWAWFDPGMVAFHLATAATPSVE